MDAVVLARLQFALTILFHFIFPAITIGLAWLLVVIEWQGWRKGDEAWVRIGKLFGKLFAITFAVGVATGVVMEFQFGTNWARYSAIVGDIFGAPLAAEGIFAFFLESTFLGLYLFGRGRVSKGVHWFSILMVAVGATISAFWILVANSWQQTPDGFTMNLEANRAELTSFVDAVFNPSTLPRFFHTIIASLVAGSFFVAGIAAYFLLKKREIETSTKALKLAVGVGLVAAIFSVFPTGHHHAMQVAETQPAKFAAMEGLYTRDGKMELVAFGIPTTDPPTLHFKIGIPGALKLLTGGKDVAYLDELPPDEVPQGFELWMTFISFHTMVGLGGLFIALMGAGVYLLRRKQKFEGKLGTYWLKGMVLAIPLPILAIELGWIVAEVGRQPWIVQGILRTEDASSLTVSAGEILISIILFSIIYLMLGAVWLFLLGKKIKLGFESATAGGYEADPPSADGDEEVK